MGKVGWMDGWMDGWIVEVEMHMDTMDEWNDGWLLNVDVDGCWLDGWMGAKGDNQERRTHTNSTACMYFSFK
eukprot:NODE_6588_length_256_cov_26.289855_g6505_i0.p2 GENE.NODE_6588_length_256_cov_26.289855_g6505_i0~~NODE_6588_length_256_cov_26.289855_g6505_i0.p2  ORF type:complete len:79 (+),score=27.36 NODE_6588_length_256_cov_26.289855_g6505_i0:24-239(+)